MERLEFSFPGFDGGATGAGSNQPGHTLAGVVGSGNLEVLMERADLGGQCAAVVETASRGYETMWRRVLEEFFRRQRLSDVRVSISDGGATPAIVRLRLDQAARDLRGDLGA